MGRVAPQPQARKKKRRAILPSGMRAIYIYIHTAWFHWLRVRSPLYYVRIFAPQSLVRDYIHIRGSRFISTRFRIDDAERIGWNFADDVQARGRWINESASEITFWWCDELEGRRWRVRFDERDVYASVYRGDQTGQIAFRCTFCCKLTV